MLLNLASWILSYLCPIPAFYTKVPVLYSEIPDFYADIYPFGFCCDINACGRVLVLNLRSVANYGTRAMRRRGGGGAHVSQKLLCRCARKIILARHLLNQVEAQSLIPVYLPAPQETGDAISEDNAEVRPHSRDCNTSFYPSTYFWNGFLELFRHEPTQIRY